MPRQSLVLPSYQANELGVEVGETILIRMSTVTGQQNVGEFVVEAISAGDSLFSFAFAYADRAFLNTLIGLADDQYQVLNVGLDRPTEAASAANRLLDHLRQIGRAEPAEEAPRGVEGMMAQMENLASVMGGGAFFSRRIAEEERWEGTRFDVLSIDDMMATVNNMVSVLNTVSYVIFLILLLITMVGLLNTFRMVLIERTGEIGTMRAIGMHRFEVRNIFLSEALVLALLGVVAGLVVSVVLGTIIGAINFPADSPLQLFLRDDSLAFPFVPGNVLAALLITTAVALTAAYFPARKAARLEPAAALRATY